MKNIRVIIVAVTLLVFSSGCASFRTPQPFDLELDGLSAGNIAQVKDLLKKLEPFILKLDRKGELPYLNSRTIKGSMQFLSDLVTLVEIH